MYTIVTVMTMHIFVHKEMIIDTLFVAYDNEGAARNDASDYDEFDVFSNDEVSDQDII